MLACSDWKEACICSSTLKEFRLWFSLVERGVHLLQHLKGGMHLLEFRLWLSFEEGGMHVLEHLAELLTL
jgi:hypothetical protein